MKRDGRLRRKAGHLRVRRLPPQTSVTAGTILHASNHRLVLGRLPDGDPLQRHLCPAGSRNSSVSALTAALGCSPTSCAPAWSTPSATRCRAWWKSTRPRTAFHSGPKTILPPEGKDAATTARCSSSAPSNSGTETSQGNAAAGRNLLLRRRRPRTLHRNRRRSRGHRRKPTAGPATLRSPPIATMSMSSGRPPLRLVLPWSTKSSPTSTMGARRVPGLRRKHLQAYLDEFVFRFNRRKTRHAAFRSALGSPPMQNPLPTAC